MNNLMDKLTELGVKPAALRKRYVQLAKDQQQRLDYGEAVFLVITGHSYYLTSFATPSLMDETPCIVIQLEKK